MAGYLKSTAEALLRLLLIVFILGMATHPRWTCGGGDGGGEYVLPRDRTVFFCTTLATALVLWFVKRSADGGGRLLRGLLLLGVGLSAASWFLLLEPVIGYTITVYRLGCDWSLALAAAGVVGVTVAVVVHVLFAAEALFDAN